MAGKSFRKNWGKNCRRMYTTSMAEVKEQVVALQGLDEFFRCGRLSSLSLFVRSKPLILSIISNETHRNSAWRFFFVRYLQKICVIFCILFVRRKSLKGVGGCGLNHHLFPQIIEEWKWSMRALVAFLFSESEQSVAWINISSCFEWIPAEGLNLMNTLLKAHILLFLSKFRNMFKDLWLNSHGTTSSVIVYTNKKSIINSIFSLMNRKFIWTKHASTFFLCKHFHHKA